MRKAEVEMRQPPIYSKFSWICYLLNLKLLMGEIKATLQKALISWTQEEPEEGGRTHAGKSEKHQKITMH